MSTTAIFVLIAAFVAFLAFLVVWSRRESYARPLAVCLFLLSLPALAYAGIQTTGYHRSLTWSALKAGDYIVLSAKLVQDQAIYLYLDTRERIEPWPVILPWNNAVAEKINQAMEQSKRDGEGGQIVFRYEPSLDINERQFHAPPQPKALPDKPAPPANPFYQDS